MKLLTITVPCFNSEAYMEKCINSLLAGGDRVEILIVDDGSTDGTGEIADRFERENQGIVRALHQENKGHGGAVNTGIANARGKYFKVVDSDDHLNKEAFLEVLDVLENMTNDRQYVDMFLSNYVYDKQGAGKKMVMRYGRFFPENTIFGWGDSRKLDKFHYVLMHSIIYRTSILRKSGLKLPEHTFYVDNLYAFVPIPFVKRLYYLNVDLYRYYIGRPDQSVQENVMVKRLDQQILVNRLMIEYMAKYKNVKGRRRDFLVHAMSIIMTVTSATCQIAGTKERTEDMKKIWNMLKKECPEDYNRIRFSASCLFTYIPLGEPGRKFTVKCYHISQKIWGFN